MSFTVEDVRAWKNDPITKEFFSVILVLVEDADKCVHRCLEENDLQDAALHNAGMSKLKDVLDIPDELINNIRQEGV